VGIFVGCVPGRFRTGNYHGGEVALVQIWHSRNQHGSISTSIQSNNSTSSSSTISKLTSDSLLDSSLALDLPFPFPFAFFGAFLYLVASSACLTPTNSAADIKCFPSITCLLPLRRRFLELFKALFSSFSFSTSEFLV
jgi:hypothetical protein